MFTVNIAIVFLPTSQQAISRVNRIKSTFQSRDNLDETTLTGQSGGRSGTPARAATWCFERASAA